MAKKETQSKEETSSLSVAEELKPKDLVLTFALELKDFKGECPVKVSQKFTLNSIKEPALLPEAESTVKNLVEMMGTSPFYKLMHSYISRLMEEYYEQQTKNTTTVVQHVYESLPSPEIESQTKEDGEVVEIEDVTTILEPEETEG